MPLPSLSLRRLRSLHPRAVARSVARRPARLVVSAVVLLVLVGGLGAWLLTREQPAAAATVTATVGVETLRETVSAQGTLEPAKGSTLTFPVSGTVTSVRVEPGDTVRRGQVLAVVDDAALVAVRRAADASLTAAQEQLAEHRSDGSSDVQVAADEAAVVSARAALADAEADVSAARLTADMRGTVTAVGLSVGDVVGGATGQGAATTEVAGVELVSTGRFVVEASVAATDVEDVEAGQQVELTVTGVDDVVYGTVAEVGMVAESSDTGAAVFPVTVEVTGTRDDLYAGTAATLTIIVSQRTDVLTVDSRALTSEDGRTYATLVTDEGTEQVEVTTGAVSGRSTEVLSGLAEGDVVMVATFTVPAGDGAGGRGSGGFGGQVPGGQAPIIPLEGIRKTYRSGVVEHEALRGVDAVIEEGEYVAVLGPSGSGKSTLMNILGCLDSPTQGRYLLAGEDVSTMTEPELAVVRNVRIGFVFQQFHLLASQTAQRNVELPLVYAGVGRAERRERARAALERVGLGDRVDHRPGELSGGQQQRVAVARALVTEPSLVLADEPTGNLDSRSTSDVLDLLDELHDAGRTIVLITHEHEVAARSRRTLVVEDGRVVRDTPLPRRSLAARITDEVVAP